MKAYKGIIGLLILTLLAGCGGNRFVKNPVDILVKEIPRDRVFSIILNDMNVEGSFFKTYTHQYVIVEEKEAGKPTEEETGWFEVDEHFFNQHANNMGMEIASRGEDGKLHKSASPPGYNNYVGNSRYGHWQNSGGHSFWAFYGQYAFMSSMFRMATYPVRRSYYDDYRGNYYGTGRSYYGPSTGGRSTYGTNSKYTSSTRPNSRWGRNTSSFKQRVANRTSQSSTSKKTTSSSSRWGSSSSRSRGGGFGK
ncbi:MAG: hypothetical protein JXQ96_07915 [Cyclobacteriaceae bacterium]